MYNIHFTYGSYGSKLTINLQFYNFTNLQIYKIYNFNKIESWQYIKLQLQFYNFTIQLQLQLQFYKYFTYNYN